MTVELTEALYVDGKTSNVRATQWGRFISCLGGNDIVEIQWDTLPSRLFQWQCDDGNTVGYVALNVV